MPTALRIALLVMTSLLFMAGFLACGDEDGEIAAYEDDTSADGDSPFVGTWLYKQDNYYYISFTGNAWEELQWRDMVGDCLVSGSYTFTTSQITLAVTSSECADSDVGLDDAYDYTISGDSLILSNMYKYMEYVKE